jgi:hypothetical protein
MRTTPAGALPFVRPTSMLEASRGPTVPAMASVAAPIMTGDAHAGDPPASRGRRLWLPLLLVGAAIAVGGGWYATRKPPGPAPGLGLGATTGTAPAASAAGASAPAHSGTAVRAAPAVVVGARTGRDDVLVEPAEAKLPAAIPAGGAKAAAEPRAVVAPPRLRKPAHDRAKSRAPAADDDMWDRRH